MVKAVLTVKYIINGVLVSSYAAKDSNKKLLSVSMPQLQSTLLFTKTCGWLGISIGLSLFMVQIIHLSFGHFTKIISLPLSSSVRVISDLLW